MCEIRSAVIEEARDRISVLSRQLKEETSKVENQFERITDFLYIKISFCILVALGIFALMFFIPLIVFSDNDLIVAGYNIMAYSVLAYLLAVDINSLIRYLSCVSTKKAIVTAERLSELFMGYAKHIDEFTVEVNNEINTGSGHFERNRDLSVLYKKAMEMLVNCNVRNMNCNVLSGFKDVLYWPCSIISVIGFALLLAPGVNNMIDSIANVNIGEGFCALINLIVAIIVYVLINRLAYIKENIPGIGLYVADIGGVTVTFPVVLLVVALISIVVAVFTIIVGLLIVGGILAFIFGSNN